jgi:outer membrane scaffolding protein for murein synthesis (MipA/OmpV family)
MPRAGVKAAIVLLATALPLAGFAETDPILLGAGLWSRPEYDGSASRRTDVIPLLRYYGSPWFARTTQGMLEGGVRQELAPRFWAGAQLAFEPGRDEPPLDAGASVGLHLEWDRRFGRVPVGFLIRARQHLDTARGGQADLRITAGVFSGHGLLVALFTQATWGSENAVASLYGPPNSGLLFLGAGVEGAYELGRHWVVLASAHVRTLHDEAEASPLAERSSARYASAGLAYRF